LILVFGLTWIAETSGTSALVAGFASGIAVAAAGADDRLLTEVVGIGEGFFIPAFFVALGTTLRPQALGNKTALTLAGLLVVASIGTHYVGSLVARSGWRGTFVACAQLGVPAAVVTIGTANGWLPASQATAIMGVSLLSIGLCSFGALLSERPTRIRDRGTLTHLLAPFS
jgi:Kef-type K+ transport system membrane component KefB